MVKGDSAARHHYWRPENSDCLQNKTTNPGPSVQIPDGHFIRATQQGTSLMLLELSTSAKKVFIITQLKGGSLISIGQSCDDGYNVLLNEKKMYAVKKHKIILEGDRNTTDGLWNIPVYKT